MELFPFLRKLTVGKVLAGVILVYFIVKISVDWISVKSTAYKSRRELHDWFTNNDLDLIDKFIEAGVNDLDDLASMSVYDEEAFKMLPRATLDSVNVKLIGVRQKKITEYWLKNHHLSKYYDRLDAEGITTLKELSDLSDSRLVEIAQNKAPKLRRDIAELKRLIRMKNYDYTSVEAVRQHMNMTPGWRLAEWLWAGLLSGCVALIIFVLFTDDGRQRIQNIPKSGVFAYIKERYTAQRHCAITLDWVEPAVVGEMVSFRIELFSSNSKPYVVTPTDDIVIAIERHTERVPMDLDYCHGGVLNCIRVSFTVYQAGLYTINVWLGNKQADRSPISCVFQCGTIDAAKTGFTQFCSTVVCCRDVKQPLVIDPRDSYGNVAMYNPDDARQFKIKVCQAGCDVRHFPPTHIISAPELFVLTMYLTMEKAGCYQATVTYGDEKLHNGDFDIIVLDTADHERMTKCLENNNRRVSYEARLMSTANDVYDKPKKIYIYISPKQLTLKEFYLRIIGKKLFTFRVCPSTKFIFHGQTNETATFTIDDGCQPKVTVAAKDHILVAATFSSYLLRNIGGSETFKDKQAFFFHEVRQLHSSRKHAPLHLKVARSDLLNTSIKETKSISLSGWCSNFTIKFNKEEGMDYGGVRREWFELLCQQLFEHSPSGLFCRFSENSQGLVHPNPKRSGEYKLKHYEFAGRIVAKCLYESALGGSYRQNVKARFTRSFLAQIIGLRVNYRHFESDDPELYTSKIQYIRENPVEDLDLWFTQDIYDSAGKLLKTVELKSNGSKTQVNDANKLEYLDMVTQQTLVWSVKDEVDAFLKGINEIIPDNLLSIFDENELELLLCGTNDYNIEDFKAHHAQCGTSPAFVKVVGWFWTVVGSFTNEQMARLLQFTTGSSMLPPGGFAQLSPNFQISATFTYGTLPTAHTCFNQLCLPDYGNIEAFHKALCLAINEGSQGFGFT